MGGEISQSMLETQHPTLTASQNTPHGIIGPMLMAEVVNSHFVVTLCEMSTVSEIEDAIERLSAVERDALESRLLSRRFGMDALNVAERTELLASLDEAEREIDDGRAISAEDLRRDVRAWLGK